MQIKNAKFFTSVANIKNFPQTSLPEFCFVGKSNVGKSSLINFLVGQKNLAVTSKIPGRTRLINLFLINNEFYFVDLPGYGFSASSKQTTENFSNLIEAYFEVSKNIKQIFILVDIRHGAGENDIHMASFCMIKNLPFTVIATKADKLNKSESFIGRQKIATALKIGVDNVIVTSSLKKLGKEDILEIIEKKM